MIVAFCLALVTGRMLPAQTPPAQTPTGSSPTGGTALTTLFSPARAPAQKTMGLLQRSFLDMVDQNDQPLEVALVVDGTDSMTRELASVRESILKMLGDLRRFRGNQVRFALVIYRDSGSPSGEVSILLNQFTTEDAVIQAAVDKLQAEDGAPFFHELADVGLHHALSDLPWSTDPQTARWVILFGDAPPYAESFKDASLPQARRRFTNEILLTLAARKNIRVHCILCNSDEKVREPYERALEQTRSFMSAMSEGTDGLMLDLSYAEIQQALASAQKLPETAYLPIAKITKDDLSAVRSQQAIDEPSAGPSGEVRLAILPHLPLDRMTFDPADPAVQISTALRQKLSTLPGVRITSPVELQRQLRRLKADGIAPDQQLRALASRLGVDYVVWGEIKPDQLTRTVAYRRDDGTPAVQVSFKTNEAVTSADVLLKAASGLQSEATKPLAKLMEGQRSLQAREELSKPIAATPSVTRDLLTALEALEQALGMTVGAPESIELLQKAIATAQTAAQAEPRNAMAQWLLANARINLGTAQFREGNAAAAESTMQQAQTDLRTAYRERRSLPSTALRLEIEADYALLIDHQFETAIEGYRKLTADNFPSATRRRAHWMLAGLYTGDWGAGEKYHDATAAREHVIAILANWEECPEAELFRAWLRWDPQSGQTKFNHLPKKA